MSFLANKHVVAAMIVAPMLAIIMYIAVDFQLKEQPQLAMAGRAYPLSAQSNCRFSSGQCDLVNGNFSVSIRVGPTQRQLMLTSPHGLQGVTVGFIQDDEIELPPVAMVRAMLDFDSNGEGASEGGAGVGAVWTANIPKAVTDQGSIRLAIRAGGAHYYAESVMKFAKYQTVYKQDFRHLSEPKPPSQ